MTHSIDTEPSVSVVVPAYRVTGFVSDAIRSVLAQTRPANEIIVVNDGCPDTPSLKRALAPFMDRITYLERPNGGPAAARNTGIRHASGDLVAFLDADDVWVPTFLERQVSFMQKHADVIAACSGVSSFYGAVPDGDPPQNLPPRESSFATPRALLALEFRVTTSALMARREALFDAGLFDENIGNYSEDFDLWLRLSFLDGRLACQHEVLVWHREHQDSLTGLDYPVALAHGLERVLEKTRRQRDLSNEERNALEALSALNRAGVLVEEAKELVLAGRHRDAHRRMREAYALAPSPKRRVVVVCLRLVPWLIRYMLRSRARRSATPAPNRV